MSIGTEHIRHMQQKYNKTDAEKITDLQIKVESLDKKVAVLTDWLNNLADMEHPFLKGREK